MVLYQKYIILIKNYVAQPCPVKNAPTFVSDMTKISQIRENSNILGKITLFSCKNQIQMQKFILLVMVLKIKQSINCSKNNIGEYLKFDITRYESNYFTSRNFRHNLPFSQGLYLFCVNRFSRQLFTYYSVIHNVNICRDTI